MFNAWLNSAMTAKEGMPASGNYERFSDKTADQLLADYKSSSSLTGQKQAMAGLEGILINQLPVIPIMYQTDWGEYNTEKFTGWPLASDPYAIASTYDRPMNELGSGHRTALDSR
jgi:peptide/nickel transport system substrate-binding protein